MSARRVVRASPSFFDDLDRQLRTDRSEDGEPSTNDFQSLELIEIVDRFAECFDELPEAIPGRSDYKMLISAGRIVRGYTVVAQLMSDGTVELIALEIDSDWQP